MDLSIPEGCILIDRGEIPSGIYNYFAVRAASATSIYSEGAYFNRSVVQFLIGPGRMICYKENSCHIVRSRAVKKSGLHVEDYRSNQVELFANCPDFTEESSEDSAICDRCTTLTIESTAKFTENCRGPCHLLEAIRYVRVDCFDEQRRSANYVHRANNGPPRCERARKSGITFYYRTILRDLTAFLLMMFLALLCLPYVQL
jgi:hypothetical protein